jgi:hypothetical protein
VIKYNLNHLIFGQTSLATNITEKKGFPFHKVENEDLILGQFALSVSKLWHIGNVLKNEESIS